MKRVTILKILLILVAGASASIPLRRLMERRPRPAEPGELPGTAPSPAAERKAPDPFAPPPAALRPESSNTAAAPAVEGSSPPAARTTAPPAPSPAGAARKTYVVREGDSFWSIAEKELGSGKHAKKIIDANRDRIDPNNLKVGQVLVLPDLDAEVRRLR